jgi:RNA recognition motif-containing protein
MLESKRLFIGGLVASVTEDEVKERFNRFGEVDEIEIKIKDDNLSKLQCFWWSFLRIIPTQCRF